MPEKAIAGLVRRKLSYSSAGAWTVPIIESPAALNKLSITVAQKYIAANDGIEDESYIKIFKNV